MSHFAVYVFNYEDDDIENILAPYDENISVAPYIEYTRQGAIDNVRRGNEEYKNGMYAEYLADPEKYAEECGNPDHLKYISEEFPKRLNWTDEECYQYIRGWYDDRRVDEQGNLYSTYNPNAKWDWYEIGGRWSGEIKEKNGDESNEALVNNVDWDKTYAPFAFIDTLGRWHERGQMGWWAIVTNEQDKDEWETQFRNYLATLGDDVYVTLVDCHI